ncbi:hypothetical protein Q9L58_000308 [Maublancomyces gigas]|uniref:Kelch repeat protein n=1 Tax=Discina gigas TaxID=1032678 RepID=A0ABR3GXH3_9PEZI
MEVKKAVDVPVLNRFGVWADSNQNSIYIQGGHFYTATGWEESQYNVNDSAIPAYSIWRFDLSSQKWTNVTGRGNSKDRFERAVAGAAVSVPSMNQSFYAGGIVTSRSDPTAQRDLFVPQAGMLIYEHDNDNLKKVTYGSDEEQGYGFWHGSLNHMQLGEGKGFLISLMGETAIAGVTRPDAPKVNDETGIPVKFDHVLFYDLDKNKWYKQKTTSIDDDLPVTRTRFCGQTVYSKDTNTWDTPKVVRDRAELDSEKRREPYLKPWADPVLKSAFDYNIPTQTLTPPPPPPPGFPGWEIAVIVIGVLAGLTVIAAIAYFIMKYKGRISDVNGHPAGALRESGKKIVGVRVEFSNFEYTINKRKYDIQTETRKLFQDSQCLVALAKASNTDMAKTKRDSNRKRLGELHAEMNTLSRLQREEKMRIEQRSFSLNYIARKKRTCRFSANWNQRTDPIGQDVQALKFSAVIRQFPPAANSSFDTFDAP